jgi:hypothetical protein
VLDYNYGGIPSIIVSPRSSVILKASGDTSNGGRFTRLEISGEVNISVSTVNPFSEVQVCFKNQAGKQGCGLLRSDVRFAPTPNGVVIATTEGSATLSTESFDSVVVKTNQYSIFKPDGTFTPPKDVYKTVGYRVLQVNRGGRNHTATYRALEGWRFEDCSTEKTEILGTTPKMLSPLESCLPATNLKDL